MYLSTIPNVHTCTHANATQNKTDKRSDSTSPYPDLTVPSSLHEITFLTTDTVNDTSTSARLTRLIHNRSARPTGPMSLLLALIHGNDVLTSSRDDPHLIEMQRCNAMGLSIRINHGTGPDIPNTNGSIEGAGD